MEDLPVRTWAVAVAPRGPSTTDLFSYDKAVLLPTIRRPRRTCVSSRMSAIRTTIARACRLTPERTVQGRCFLCTWAVSQLALVAPSLRAQRLVDDAYGSNTSTVVECDSAKTWTAVNLCLSRCSHVAVLAFLKGGVYCKYCATKIGRRLLCCVRELQLARVGRGGMVG